MPARLRPKRDAHGHRYWTPELIEQIKEWIEKNHFHPGRGIDYHPTPEQLRRHVDKIRAAAHARSNEFSDEAEMLRIIARDALNNRGLTPDQLVENLPQVHDQLVAGGYEMTLADATRIVSEVIQEYGE